MAKAILHQGKQKRIAGGHPWIYRTEIKEIVGSFEPGDIVEVFDYRDKFVGKGYINPASQITIRIMTRNPLEEVNEEFFRRRITAAWNYRQRVVKDTNSCRVIFGEADFLPALIVDKFGDYLSVQTLALGIDVHKETIIRLLYEIVQPRGIYERNDVTVRKIEGLPLITGFIGEPFDPKVVIHENGLKFVVDLEGGQKTGYFLDQRENRLALQGLVKGGRVLDCFCHTGTFSMYAAKFGAREVLGLDIAASALETARANAQLNGYGDICSFKETNSFDELRAMEKSGEQFELVVLDPPAFTKSKGAVKGAIRGYKEINLRGMKLIPPGGFLVTCSCSYHMKEELFLETVLDAGRDAGRELRLVELRRQAKDHPMLLASPESHYLKCMILQVF
ncbi:class I SAM-dependent rRNA methyltransferase [Desulforamulus aquiferis]|uniref:Class I SAM-dependent rRNA methyltransferase n=1 Tax=Desulforamulus aquiferis TaxID=1397668 RepID=A0AAW7ZCM4_9FIRM|nr:class I SAM-dependent rRNA methyltransferase [Desulforamulus aquiferis]MDO7787188.1 class I SAM-dependent rRNA methyltransferase [Desulforamulus aquiferis]